MRATLGTTYKHDEKTYSQDLNPQEMMKDIITLYIVM